MRIKRLVCRVSIKTGKKGPLLHGSERAAKPSMMFALVAPHPKVESGPDPSEMATEEREAVAGDASESKHKPSPRNADVRAVTDRVYELMKHEIALARERGAVGRKG